MCTRTIWWAKLLLTNAVVVYRSFFKFYSYETEQMAQNARAHCVIFNSPDDDFLIDFFRPR